MKEHKTPKHPAVKMKKRLARKMLALKHCCIPATSVKTETIEYEDGSIAVINPSIKANGNGPLGKAGEEYKKLKAARIKELRKYFIKRHGMYYKAHREQPWYMLQRKKRYVYEEQKKSWGTEVNYFKKESEYFELYKRTIIPKLTKEELTIRLLSAKLKDWETKNPKPSKDDMFYWQEMGPWINRYQAAHSRIAGRMGLLSKKPLPDFVKNSYEKYEKEFKKEYDEHWQKNKAA